ncbi:MAG: alpha/beta hydrolase [bacterium]|nr:alpha/beta hydrolase [Candidatus Minthenecus merdequi]
MKFVLSKLLCGRREHSGLCDRLTSSKMPQKKRAIIFTVVMCFNLCGVAAQDTATFAIKDDRQLKMTIYQADNQNRQPETIIYMFGGGFYTGSRNGERAVEYCKKMQERGFTTVSIDYRLGIVSDDTTKAKVNASISEFENAMRIAVEDLSSAVVFLINNGQKWGIDKDKIIITGCSAGAVTALNADYCHANGSKWTEELPEDFRFYGVMAYAGAIFSRNGKVKWSKHSPAPTMLYHGTKDKTVIYGSIQFGLLGFFGTNSLAKRFKKYDYPVKIRRFIGAEHEVSSFGNIYVEDAIFFIENWLRKGKQWISDENFSITKQ